MNVDWDKICDFVFDTFGDDNPELARYTLADFGIDPDTRRPFDRCLECGETETTDPYNDGVPVCTNCGRRR